jgi:hypothetical protein
MTAPTTVERVKTDVTILIDHFLGNAQKRVVLAALRGEEKKYFSEKLIELAALVASMPVTYQNDFAPGPRDPIVYLHYFVGNGDWYVIEKDVNLDGEGQIQAFGLADPYRDGGELGYISLPEVLGCGAELDFHFEPRPLSLLRDQRSR